MLEEANKQQQPDTLKEWMADSPDYNILERRHISMALTLHHEIAVKSTGGKVFGRVRAKSLQLMQFVML